MAELSLMASHGYPLGPKPVFDPEHSIARVPKDCQPFISYPGPNLNLLKPHSYSSSQHQIDDWKSTSRFPDSNQFAMFDSTVKTRTQIDAQDNFTKSVLFSLSIAEQCIRQEKIMKLLEEGLLDPSMVVDLMGHQPLSTDLCQEPFAPCSEWCHANEEDQQSLIYPTSELYFRKPVLDLRADILSRAEIKYDPDVLSKDGTGTEMNHVLSTVAEFYLSKNSNRRTMLVPYFERRRKGARAKANTKGLELETAKAAPVKSPGKAKDGTLLKKTNKEAGKEKDLQSKSYVRACETLLSIMVDKNQQPSSAILSLKKSSPKLPQLLSRCSSTIAGTGIAVLFSVICKLAFAGTPFCSTKLLTTGLGLALVWLSWGVNNLRRTIISISKNCGKLGAKEDDMMGTLDRSLKDVYYRAATLMAMAVLRLA